MTTVETFKHAGNTVTIEYDEDCSNPRKDFDNFGTMICGHRRYDLGDIQIKEPRDWHEHRRGLHIAVMLPLYLYDHSGITMSAGGHNFPDAQWDVSMVGYIYCTREDIVKEYGSDKPEHREQALTRLHAEVEIYDSYLRGECYGYVVESPEGDVIDSCWDFLGDVNYCIEQAKAAADAHANE